MIEGIEFKNEIFETTEDNNIVCPMTNNMVIICDSCETKNIIAKEFETINDESGADYYSTNDDNVNIRPVIWYRPTTIFAINDEEQRIIITVEDPFVLTVKEKYDLWFAARNKYDKIEVYPFVAFKGYKDVWDAGIIKVYKDTIIGRFGNFGKYSR